MPIVLVVDDSEVDRRLMGGLLSKDMEWLVEYAGNGEAALETMRIATPDVVVTDLMMPGMDGLQLVAAARGEFPNVPVVLVTGQGSENLASQALRKGATSYVPKALLSEALLETVEQVLALASVDHKFDRLMRCTTNIRHKFQLDSNPELIGTLGEFVRRTMTQMRFGDAADWNHVGVALEEALLNALCHGNLEIPAEQLPQVRQQLHDDGSSALIEERRQDATFGDRKILVGFDVTHERAQFVIRDSGAGFDTSQLPAAADPASLCGERGRGLVLIQNFMDEVSFNETGNELHMSLNRPARRTSESAAAN
jgi:CheY-like chemotaxis protein/anti-sigma regulatory factor (Ser/Thr protein kinase)